jgi:hypothetical protein
MYAGFKYETLQLKDILLDYRNPRIVTQSKFSKQEEILSYLYEHEALDDFVQLIARDGRNYGAERPYVIKDGSKYVVIEGNTRVAAYKILTGLLIPPKGHSVPHISKAALENLVTIESTVAPDRESLMPIMAKAHFGLGDKSKWGYLGSRRVVYDEWKAGHSLAKLAKVFDQTPGKIKDFILEYMLYQKALGLSWTKEEKARLTDPAVEFNPPVRFLQTSGHKEKVGISYDTTNLKVVFVDGAEKKFKHLLKKLVIEPEKGLGATASYEAVFSDFGPSSKASDPKLKSGESGGSSGSAGTGSAGSGSGKDGAAKGPAQKKPNSLFSYQPSITNGLVVQLMKEAKEIDAKKFPAAATFLLRNIVESILRHIIEDQKANKKGESLDLEACLNLCANLSVKLPANDKKILSQFRKDHLVYLNLGAHGIVIPNADRLAAARDCIDQFVKKHV